MLQLSQSPYMDTEIVKTLLAVILPLAVFGGVGSLMAQRSGRKKALQDSHPPNPKPLNTRLSYAVDDVDDFWRALGADGLIAERRFLEFDLIFPALYGGALTASLLWLALEGRSWLAIVGLALVVVGVVADWAENLIQLEQLRLYSRLGRPGLQPQAVRSASAATAVKLIALGSGFFALVVAALAHAIP
jgi:hypothetical protein